VIFLSKKGKDPYINMLAKGCNAIPVSSEDFDYDSSSEPIVLRGILQTKLINRCLRDRRDFYYMDTGYFGNENSSSKIWHRIVKNGLQHNTIIDRPDDRFKKLNKRIQHWTKSGSKVLIIPPGPKPCKHYGIDINTWTNQVVTAIKQHTDRPFEIRTKPKYRNNRVSSDTLQSALLNDVYAVVAYNSIAAVESIFNGIPVFTTGVDNAAIPVSSQDLTQIESPYYAERDKLYKWACCLAYGQYHVSELRNGTAIGMAYENG
jgi:hypothetical protein